MEPVLLSIIICTFNRVKLLEDSLRSVLIQETSFPYEVIVGDDCSTDETTELLSKMVELYPNVIRINRLPVNMGIGANWASAVKLAKGRYVAFLDDDDYWTDCHRMQIMVDYMETHLEIGVLYTNGYTLNEKTGKKKLIVFPENNYPDIYEMWQGRQPNVPLNMAVVRNYYIKECIKLDDYIKYRFPIQDWNTNILLLKKAYFAYMDMPTCIIRMTDGSLSRTTDYDRLTEKYARESKMCKYLAEQFPDDPMISFDEAESNKYINHILATAAFNNGDYRKAKYFTRLSGGHSLRDKSTCSWITFQLFRIAKVIRRI